MQRRLWSRGNSIASSTRKRGSYGEKTHKQLRSRFMLGHGVASTTWIRGIWGSIHRRKSSAHHCPGDQYEGHERHIQGTKDAFYNIPVLEGHGGWLGIIKSEFQSKTNPKINRKLIDPIDPVFFLEPWFHVTFGLYIAMGEIEINSFAFRSYNTFSFLSCRLDPLPLCSRAACPRHHQESMAGFWLNCVAPTKLINTICFTYNRFPSFKNFPTNSSKRYHNHFLRIIPQNGNASFEMIAARVAQDLYSDRHTDFRGVLLFQVYFGSYINIYRF